MGFSRHSLALLGAIALGALLRFAHLDLKPLWLDEVLTALYSQGRSYEDIPLDVLLPLDRLEQIFTLNPAATCSQIAQTLATQSTHPPVFFCWMHGWLNGFHWSIFAGMGLAWQMRSLSVLFGVGAIATVYWLNRVAFSPAAGLTTAFVMAVSPFGVYLSQEARHYTLPVLLIALALLGLIQIQQDFCHKQRLRPLVWLGWVAINSLGFYIHYFFILAFIAQIATLFGFYKNRLYLSLAKRPNPPAPFPKREGGEITPPRNGEGVGGEVSSLAEIPPPRYAPSAGFANGEGVGGEVSSVFVQKWDDRRWFLVFLIVCSLLPIVFFLPWLPIMLSHFGRSETSWIPHAENIAPLYQTLAAWLTMAIALPVESQPIWIIIPAAVLMILFGGWLGWHVFLALKQLWHHPDTQLSTQTLVSFTFWVLLQFFAIVYLLGKDLSIAPRYHFIYYPALWALLGAGIWKIEQTRQQVENKSLPFPSPFSLLPSLFNPTQHSILNAVLFVGVFSCILLTSDLAYQKPFYPQQVAQNMILKPSVPRVVVVGYKNLQDVALGLSFVLEIHKRDAKGMPGSYVAFLKRSPEYAPVWQSLSQLSPMPALPLDLWVVAPEMRRSEYPSQLLLSSQSTENLQSIPACNIDTAHFYRIGVPYQLYRCILPPQ